MASIQIASNLWWNWAEISLVHARAARDARRRVLAAAPGTVEAQAIHEEFLNALVAVCSAAFAVDAWYIAVEPMAEYSPAQPPEARFGWVMETLKSGFDLGPLGNSWQPKLKKLYRLRDAVVHFESQSNPAVPHASGITNVSRENAVYSAEEAETSAMLAVEVIAESLRRPRGVRVALGDWCAARSHVPGDLETRRNQILGTAN